LTGDARRHKGDRFDGPALRDFNFTVYALGARGIDADVRGVAKGADAVRTIDRFTMEWP
jgi:hypothetical protein